MITDPITKEHLCFDYTGSDDEVLDLIDDEFSGELVDRLLYTLSSITNIEELVVLYLIVSCLRY